MRDRVVGLPEPGATPEDALATIREYLGTIRFGSIALTIHEGRIVQLDVTEKRRLAR